MTHKIEFAYKPAHKSAPVLQHISGFEVGVLDHPFFHIDIEPEGINTYCDDGKQHPFDICSEKLTARAVKGELFSVKHGVRRDPALLKAHRPWSADAERDQSY